LQIQGGWPIISGEQISSLVILPSPLILMPQLWELLPITQAQFTLGLVVAVFTLLMVTAVPPDVILVGGVVLLMAVGILTPDQALAGMSNEGMITVAVLFVVGAAVRETGGVEFIASRLFGRPKNATAAIARMMGPTMVLSAFMNNTPLVAMLIPAVSDWARKLRMPVSKFLIPLSYAAILGGTCTLIGTSTNLVVQGLLIKEQLSVIEQGDAREIKRIGAQDGAHGLQMFDITWVGLPAALLGGLYIVGLSRWLLPDRRPAISAGDDPREYTVEMQVPPDSPIIGKSIEAAGLRHLPGVFLAEIDRNGAILPAVSPQEILQANDRLLFAGIIESVVDLQRIRGLMPATDEVHKLNVPRPTRVLVEAVVSNTCPLVGKTIRDGRFRNTYNAVVVAVARNGERLRQKIGDIELEAGDTLLVEAHPSFAEQNRNSRDFFLVSRIEESSPPRHNKAWIAVGLLLTMVIVTSLGNMSVLLAAMLAAGLMILTKCLSIRNARRSVDWEVLASIAAAFALGTALEVTGAAQQIAETMIRFAGGNPWIALAAIYAMTLIATELITNNAAAALAFPFAIATARDLDVNAMPFVIAVAMAASAGFATPIGYQTNLMVYGPGGYKFSDYVRIGVPLDILIGVITVVLAPLVWPF
jgi:di/tricarboxylate transporter